MQLVHIKGRPSPPFRQIIPCKRTLSQLNWSSANISVNEYTGEDLRKSDLRPQAQQHICDKWYHNNQTSIAYDLPIPSEAPVTTKTKEFLSMFMGWNFRYKYYKTEGISNCILIPKWQKFENMLNLANKLQEKLNSLTVVAYFFLYIPRIKKGFAYFQYGFHISKAKKTQWWCIANLKDSCWYEPIWANLSHIYNFYALSGRLKNETLSLEDSWAIHWTQEHCTCPFAIYRFEIWFKPYLR